jgi:hypothetical protein
MGKRDEKLTKDLYHVLAAGLDVPYKEFEEVVTFLFGGLNKTIWDEPWTDKQLALMHAFVEVSKDFVRDIARLK